MSCLSSWVALLTCSLTDWVRSAGQTGKEAWGLWRRLTELQLQKLPFVSIDFNCWGDSSPEQVGEFVHYTQTIVQRR